MDKQREEFEEAFKNNNAYNIELIHGTNTPTFEKNSKGEYLKVSVQNHWEMWQQAQKVAVPEGFVLVNKNKSEAFSKKLNDYLDDAWRDGSAFDDGFVSVDEINHDKIWSLVVEAQEQMG